MLTYTISTASQFRDEFVRYGRKDQFSYDALGLLFEYFDNADERFIHRLDPISVRREKCQFKDGRKR